MKNSHATILAFGLFVAIVFTVSCGRQEGRGYPMRWPMIDARFDSLSQQLDSMLYNHCGSDCYRPLLQRAAKIAAEHPGDSRYECRLMFFRAFALRREGQPHVSDSIFDVILNSVSSISQPYLYNRVKFFTDDNSVRDVDSYDRLVQSMEYFESVGDDFHVASQAVDLGNLLKNVRDPEAALAAYRRADSLFSSLGYTAQATGTQLNMASALVILRDTVAAVDLLRQIAADTASVRKAGIAPILLQNLYTYTGDSIALHRLEQLEGDSPSSSTLHLLADHNIKRKQYRQALDYALAGIDKAMDEGDGDNLAWLLYAASDAYAGLGDSSLAYQMLKDASDITDMIALENEPEELAAVDTMRRLAQRRLEAELARSRHRLLWVCIGAALLILVLLAAWITSARIRRLKEQRAALADERDGLGRRLVATQIARDESEQLISRVGREITSLADNGQMPAEAPRKIVNAIKSHSVQQGDRETFIESFANVHPDFGRRLKQLSPAVTELDVRVASYIVMGMDTKHIAATMGVRPESVKQARWRLRSKLGLHRSDSLEDTLRGLLA